MAYAAGCDAIALSAVSGADQPVLLRNEAAIHSLEAASAATAVPAIPPALPPGGLQRAIVDKRCAATWRQIGKH